MSQSTEDTMERHVSARVRRWTRALSRRTLLRHSATAAALALVADRSPLRADAATTPSLTAATGGGALEPLDAFRTIFAAVERYPLVAIAERHWVQEWHDLITALLFHPALPRTLTDIVVEFGCAAYQDLADRFILGDRPVANADLQQIWRQLGDPGWTIPVYEQFFRTVRAANWMRPPRHRIRVLLGQPPATMDQVLAHPTSRAMLNALLAPVDDHYAAVVEREVLQKGRRALLIAGGGHLMRGLQTDRGSHHLNAAGQLAQRHPGALFVIDTLVLPPGPQQDAMGQRLQAALAGWPRPAVAALAGTWLGATTQVWDNAWINQGADRAVSRVAARYEAQADAVLYLGPGEVLTASRPDAAIYHWGTYPAQLRRLSALMSRASGQPVDLVAAGLQLAQAGPNWFATFQ